MKQLEIFGIDTNTTPVTIPIAGSFSAGFPSPATDYTGDHIDLNEIFIQDSGNTFYARVKGYYLLEGDLIPGDAMLFDTSLKPRKGDLAVCNIDGEIVVKFIDRRKGIYYLVAGTDNQTEMINEDSSSYIMGIVTTLFIRRKVNGKRRSLPRWGVRLKDEKVTKKRAIRWAYTPESENDELIKVDLNRELIKHPVFSAYGLIAGQSLREDAIDDGDNVIIDTILPPENGDLAISFRYGEFMIKYVVLHKDSLWLVPGNSEYQPIRISEEEDTRKLVWGIVTYSIKQLRKYNVKNSSSQN